MGRGDSARFKVAVAGGGPAGLAVAAMLGKAGHDVSLFERFAAPQPVGSGLMIQPTGLAVLDQMGLGDRLRARASEVDRLFGQAAPSGKTVLDVHYGALGGARGFGVHRSTLFGLLHEAALLAGVTIHYGQPVTGTALAATGRTLAFAKGAVAGPFDIVIDALGHASPLAPQVGRSLAYGALWATLDWPQDAGFDERALEQRYRQASVMVGVLPIGRRPSDGRLQAAFFWSLRADRLDDWRERGLDHWKAEVLALWPATAPLLEQIHAGDQLTFARYAHRTVDRPYAARMAHIGDAWHSTSPQLGQGANMALLDAYALVRALDARSDLAEALRLYHGLRVSHVTAYQRLSALFTPVYQSDSLVLPFLRDRIVGPLSRRWPATAILASMVSGTIGRPLHALGLATPKARKLR